MVRASFAARAAALVLLLFAGGCQALQKKEPPKVGTVEIVEEPEWRHLASPADIDRIERIDSAWADAVAQARAKGFGKAIDGEGALLDAKAGLLRPAPTPGPYSCRMIKVGTTGKAPAFSAFKPFFCYVEADGELLNIVKQTGSQRPAGWLYPDDDAKRMIFLGTLALGTEDAPIPYGQNSERDMAGVFERIGPFRFRLVIPWPQDESKLNVIELVPVIEAATVPSRSGRRS
jgi:Domain of unknown function (DUF4893)